MYRNLWHWNRLSITVWIRRGFEDDRVSRVTELQFGGRSIDTRTFDGRIDVIMVINPYDKMRGNATRSVVVILLLLVRYKRCNYMSLTSTRLFCNHCCCNVHYAVKVSLTILVWGRWIDSCTVIERTTTVIKLVIDLLTVDYFNWVVSYFCTTHIPA